MSEIRFISLTCPNCGGSMQIGSDTAAGRLNCPYCGKACLLDRGDGTLSLQPMAEELKGTRLASERVAAELAVRRLGEEIPALHYRLAQWDQAYPRPIQATINPIVVLVAVLGCTFALICLIGVLVETGDSRTAALNLMGFCGILPGLLATGVWVLLHRSHVASWKAKVAGWEQVVAAQRNPQAKQVADAEAELQRNRAILAAR